MRNWINFFMLFIFSLLVAGCGFHLRGQNGSFKFPYKTSYVDCNSAIICQGFKSAIAHESLTTLSPKPESAEATILVTNEQTSRDAQDYNSTGQIASYLLTYQITAQIYTPKGDQIGADIVVKNQMLMMYNNSLILSSAQQEDKTWDQVHQNVINTLIRRIVYSHPDLVSKYTLLPKLNTSESKPNAIESH